MRTLLQEKIILPVRVWGQLNLSWGIFFAVLGVVNLYVAFNFSTDAWVNFKIFGTTGMMLLFIVFQAMLLTKYTHEGND
jgi:intracellular septation protein